MTADIQRWRLCIVEMFTTPWHHPLVLHNTIKLMQTLFFFGRDTSSRRLLYPISASYLTTTPACLLSLYVDTQRPCLSSLCLFSSKLISAQTPSQEEQGRVKIRNKKADCNVRRGRKQSCHIKISQVVSAVNMPQSEQDFIHHSVFKCCLVFFRSQAGKTAETKAAVSADEQWSVHSSKLGTCTKHTNLAGEEISHQSSRAKSTNCSKLIRPKKQKAWNISAKDCLMPTEWFSSISSCVRRVCADWINPTKYACNVNNRGIIGCCEL